MLVQDTNGGRRPNVNLGDPRPALRGPCFWRWQTPLGNNIRRPGEMVGCACLAYRNSEER